MDGYVELIEKMSFAGNGKDLKKEWTALAVPVNRVQDGNWPLAGLQEQRLASRRLLGGVQGRGIHLCILPAKTWAQCRLLVSLNTATTMQRM